MFASIFAVRRIKNTIANKNKQCGIKNHWGSIKESSMTIHLIIIRPFTTTHTPKAVIYFKYSNTSCAYRKKGFLISNVLSFNYHIASLRYHVCSKKLSSSRNIPLKASHCTWMCAWTDRELTTYFWTNMYYTHGKVEELSLTKKKQLLGSSTLLCVLKTRYLIKSWCVLCVSLHYEIPVGLGD